MSQKCSMKVMNRLLNNKIRISLSHKFISRGKEIKEFKDKEV